MDYLQVHLYDNNMTAPARALPVFKGNITSKIKDIRLVWELHGGLRTIELDWVDSEVDAYDFYRRYLGYRLIVSDQFCDMPVADGFITGISVTADGIHILANGFWFRHFDQLYAFDETIRDQDDPASTLTYGAGTFTDDQQVFTDWDTTSGDAVYEIEVDNIGEPVRVHNYSTAKLDGAQDFATTGGSFDREWYAKRFKPPVDGQIVKASYKMKKTGTPAGTLTASVYNRSSDLPTTQVGNASATISASAFSTSYDWVDFTWSANGPQLNSGEDYFLVFKTAGHTYTDGVTEFVFGTNSTGSPGDVFRKYDANASPTWTSVGTGLDPAQKLWFSTVGSTSRAFLGTTVSATEINVFTTFTLESDTQGWIGDDPTDKVPFQYRIYETYCSKTTGEVIREAVNESGGVGEVPAVDTDQTHMDDPGTYIGFWRPPLEEGGMYPGELIEKLASFSGGSDRQWSYWVANTPYSSTIPQKPVPYFKSQIASGASGPPPAPLALEQWEIKKWMLAKGSYTMERNIQELRNAVRAIFRDYEHDDTLAMYPIVGYSEDATSIADYWRREGVVNAGDADADIAAQYVALYLNKFKDAMLTKPITITSPHILTPQGSKWPLWSPIKQNKAYFRIADLFPDSTIFTLGWDRKLVAQAMTMEYSSAGGGELKVWLDQTSDSLDAFLARLSGFR